MGLADFRDEEGQIADGWVHTQRNELQLKTLPAHGMSITRERRDPDSLAAADRGRRPAFPRPDPPEGRGALTYLLDTNVVSALAPAKRTGPPR
jgi:hypothetical protein